MYRVAPKLAPLLCMPSIYQILTDFQSYFTVRIRRKFVLILSLKIPPHLKCVATLPCEMSSVLKVTTANNTTSVTTRFKKVTTGNNILLSQLLSKVTVTSCSFYIKCSICPPCCCTTHSSRRRYSVVKVEKSRWGYCDLQFGPPACSCGPLPVKLGPQK